VARESALWKRIRDTAVPELLWTKHTVDLQRLENSVGQGHPDVEGCIDGAQIWVELKSEDRPARPTTAIKPKVRTSQSIWHRERTKAGSRIHWVLLQVGEGRKARLYLIPGDRYDEICATEAELELLSVLPPTASPADILLRATRGW
jgi:hypothetical protein